MTKFAIIHDLGSLNDVERKQYLRDASEYFQLDPDLNALDMIWMNGNDGLRRLVAYARRGTTDILRDIHGIRVTSLEQHDGLNYVSFKATGQNRYGRQEIAVGAASLEGLRHDRLAAAIATAQTRAVRRLTLQFVGGALLDESEVDGQTVSINTATEPLAMLSTVPAVQPEVQLTNEPGKDITPQIDVYGDVLLQNPPKEGDSLQIIAEPKKHKGRGPGKRKSEISLDAPVEVPGQVPKASVLVEAIKHINDPISVEVSKLDVKADVKADTSAPVQSIKSVESIIQEAPKTDIKPDIKSVLPTPIPTFTSKGPDFGDEPNQIPSRGSQKEKEHRAELFKYTEDKKGVFAQGGMTERVIVKIKKYAYMLFPGLTDTQNMTNKQWDKFLMNLKQLNTEKGAAGLVKIIEDNYLKG